VINKTYTRTYVPICPSQTTLFGSGSSDMWVTDLAIMLCNWNDG